MNKSYNMQAVHRRNQEVRRARSYSGSSRGSSHGYFIFAYKGVLLKKEEGIYSVYKQIQMSGCDPAIVDGSWNRASELKLALERMLETANTERLQELRDLRKNYICPTCKGVNYLDSQRMESFSGGDIPDTIICVQCGSGNSVHTVKITKDDVIY